MAPLIVLVVSFILFLIAGLAFPWFAASQMAGWQHALRAALGLMFLLTASAHWGRRRPDLVRMVPARFTNPSFWVTLTGLAEILIALGLQIPRLAPWAAAVAFLMLLCIFPANIKASREHLTIAGQPTPGLAIRAAIQALFLLALLAAIVPAS